MANVIRIKRRVTGNEGAPASLKNAELAFNEVDQTLYYGKGEDGSGNATSVIAIGGVGWDAVTDLSNYGALDANSTWSGVNTYSGTLDVTGTFQLGGSSVTATASELNLLDGVTATTSELNLVDGSVAGTVVNSKAVVYGASGEVDMTSLEIGGVAVTATPAELNVLDGILATTAELNILHGVTATAGELNVLDGILATTAELNILHGVIAAAHELNLLHGSASGTVVNSKAVIYGSSGEVVATTVEASSLSLHGTSVIATANELNILSGVTADYEEINLLDGASSGVVNGDKVVVYGAFGAVNASEFQVNGVAITSSVDELNLLDGVTATTAELNLLDGATAGVVVNSTAVVYGSAGEVAASSVSTTGAVSVGTDLTVTGNLTVNGTTVTVNATTVEVEDKNIVLANVDTPTDVTADGGGITVKGATDKEFKWVDATDAWTSSEHLALDAGKDLIMNGATSGAVTVVVPDVAGSNTVTLPAATGTVVLDSTVCEAVSSCEFDGGSF